VKGFAFTLGLTTLIDVFIFVIFTHPVMQLLARTKFFGGGHKLSGLDPESLGAVYRGRSRFREVQTGSSGSSARAKGSRNEAERRQTIAERKRAEALAAQGSTDARKDTES
jgi:preprotein translocase subunit SecD